MGWDGMGWDGMGWDGLGWELIRLDGAGLDGMFDLEVVSLASVHSQLWQQEVVDPPAEVDEGRVLPRHGLGGGNLKNFTELCIEQCRFVLMIV